MTKGNPTNTPSIDDRELIAGIVTRTISRLQALHDYAGRPSWEEVIAEEMRGVLESLLSERDKLEEALLDIRNRVLCPVGPSPTIDALQEIASAALNGGANPAAHEPNHSSVFRPYGGHRG